MSAASNALSEDQFLCSICLDMFTDPVSTPCGHNFCKKCISEHWDVNVPCQCPLCKKFFNTRPELQVNTFISEMVDHFRQSAQQKTTSSSSEQQAAKPGEVPCDVCTGTKLKALKSCLWCLVSYCETHLEPHLTTSGLKKHQLIDPVKNLAGRMCVKHNKLLELFCKDDQACVCMFCTVLDHKAHDVVPLKEEYEGQKAELGKIESDLQKMIQERQQKIQEMKHSVNVSRENADRKIANGTWVFNKMKDTIERHQTKVIGMIEEKHRTTKKQADGFIRELEQEISELKKRSAELEHLSHSEDHLNLLQNFSSLSAAPPTRDWTEVKVCPPSYLWNVRKAVFQLLAILKKEMKLVPISELKMVRQYAVDVTLDPDTAHKNLILSEDGKQVHHDGAVKRNLPDNPERFSTSACVLGKQIGSLKRFYYEVQVARKTASFVGVARESINRKEPITFSPENGNWTVNLRNKDRHGTSTDPPVRFSQKSKLDRVGVFVDYEEGLVAFYDVDAANLIHTFTDCSFAEKVLPLFSPCFNQGGKNSAPLIICPVNPAK